MAARAGGEPDEDTAALLARAAVRARTLALADITAENLRALAEREGYDFAVAMAYQAVCNAERHARFIADVDATRAEDVQALVRAGVRLAIVPGALYREYPETGADGRRFVDIVGRLGLAAEMVPVRSLGRIAENGAIIRRWLAGQGGRPVMLVSFSKGSADVKAALRSPEADEAFAGVRAWISVGGILNGTPLVAWLKRHRLRCALARLWMWHKGLTFAGLEDVARGPGGALDFPLRLPAHVRLCHVVAFPLRRHLSIPLAHRAFKRALPEGPSDAGGLLLGDVATFPGAVYPVWGADHYLRSAGVEDLLARLLSACAKTPV